MDFMWIKFCNVIHDHPYAVPPALQEEREGMF